MRRRPARGPALTALASLLLVAGCARPINRHAERLIREQLDGAIGPAAAWTVRVDGAPLRTIRGDIGRVAIRGEQVELQGAVRIADLEITLRDLQFDTARRRVQAIGSAAFAAGVDEAAVTRYLRDASAADPDYRVRVVRLRQDRVALYGRRRLLGRWWDFMVEAEPRPAPPTRIEFDPDRMTVAGVRVPLPREALRRLGSRLSTGLDLRALPFGIHVDDVGFAPGAVRLAGRIDTDAALHELVTRVGSSAASPPEAPR